MLNKNDIVEILKDNTQNHNLFNLADDTRKKYVGNTVHLRGLIEFSNICSKTCKYCGLRYENKNIDRYRMTQEEIVECAQNAVELGYKTIVLQSGEDNFFTRDTLCKIIKEIKRLDVAITLSIGERSDDDYKAFKEAGADRYLLRIETTDENLYKTMHPHMDFKNRLKCLENLKKIGYETGTGCLVGLPNQSLESLANDIMFFKELNADMIGIGPFLPHPDTPLSDAPHGDFNLALKVMAITRIVLKDINIPATTAMETLNKNGRIIALKSGANVIMPNVTNTKFQEKYEIYPNKTKSGNDFAEYKETLEIKLKSIGRTIAQNKGFRNPTK